MSHCEVILNIVKAIHARSYLELGIAGGQTFLPIARQVSRAIGVDLSNCLAEPFGELHWQSTDKFFAEFHEKVDVIFIDADHRFEQVKRDLMNSLRCLNPGGVIFLHDTDPISADFLVPDRCYDAYKIVDYIQRTHRYDLECITLPVEEAGLTLVRRIRDRRALAFTQAVSNPGVGTQPAMQDSPSTEQPYTIIIPSNRPHMAQTVEARLAPLSVMHWDGANYPSFSKLINDCIVHCPTELVIICSDKAQPRVEHVNQLLSKLQEGFCWVGLYYFAFFGFTKQLIRQIGFFDERFIGGGYEDSDFMVRMREVNLGYYYSNEAPYQWMPSSWDNTRSKKHFLNKWGSLHMTEAKRKLPDETYAYNLGTPVHRTFLTGEHTIEIR